MIRNFIGPLEQWINADPVIDRVIKLHDRHVKYFEETDEWRAGLERNIEAASKGEIRAFHTYYNSPTHAASGEMFIQALLRSDVEAMYPRFLDQILTMKEGMYYYIFNCCDGFGPGKALICTKVIVKEP